MERLLLFAFLFSGSSAEPVVESDLGRITGNIQSVLDVEMESFLGIPYAKPPIGDLRFALPESFGPIGDLRATEYGPPCPQPDFGMFETAGWRLEEDCLHLNVFREKGTSGNDKKAVIAIIHGGGYVMGSSSDVYQNAAALAALADVILVSFNYRIGVLGFADMKNLAPGNLGLRDQRLALQWIRDNIADFGGDPDRVTAIGVSAGSMSLAAQIITPIDEKNLFRAAVLDAGVVASNGFLEDSESSFTRIKKIAEKLGCPVGSEHMVECLRKASVEELIPLSFNVTGTTQIEFFVATEDGDFIPRNVEKYVNDNSAKLRKMPVIIGYAKDEGSSFVTPQLLDLNFPVLKTRGEILAHLAKVSASYNHPLDFTDENTRKLVSKVYVDKYPGDPRRAVAELQADGVFKCPINRFVKSYSRHNDGVYVYQFERRLRGNYMMNLSLDDLGAFHYSPYLHLSGVLFLGEDPIDSEDAKYSLDTIDMIRSFAKTDDVPSFRGMKWPAFSEEGNILIFGDDPEVRTGLSSEENCREVFARSDSARLRSEL